MPKPDDDLKRLPPSSDPDEEDDGLVIPEIISLDLVAEQSRRAYAAALTRLNAALSEEFEDAKLRLGQGKLGLDTIKHIEQHSLATLQLERSRTGQETARRVLEARRELAAIAAEKARIAKADGED